MLTWTLGAALLLSPTLGAPLRLEGDLDGDGQPDLIDWYQRRVNDARGAERGFLRITIAGRAYVSVIYAAFKARVGDLDGDGRDEIILGVWLSTPRHDEPQPHRAVWVLGFEGRLVERWRGSALARPLLDFELSADGRRLFALERGPALRLTSYTWTGFGFVGRGQGPSLLSPLFLMEM